MAVRQYIGARYTPKFVGTYDATSAYEPLTVVDNGQGTSYVSKKAVPPGTALSNTEYWALYGTSSGAILHLQEQIDYITGTTIPGVENEISGLDGEIDTITDTTIPAVEAKIGTLTNLRTPVKTDIVSAINSTYVRKLICISDSYGTYPAADNNWMNWTATSAQVSASNFFHRAVGGAGFATGGETFQQQLEAIAAGMDAQTKLEITDIVVGGGFNDAQNSNQSTVLSAIQAFRTYAVSNFPNAKLHLAFLGWSYNSEWLSKIRQYNGIRTYQEAVVYGFNYIKDAEFVLRGKNLFTEEPQGTTTLHLGYAYVHPNFDGAIAIGECIGNYLKCGDSFVPHSPQYYLVAPTLATGVSLISGSASFYMEQENETISIIKDTVGSTVFSFASAKDIRSGLLIEIGLMKSGLIAGIDSTTSGTRPLTQMQFIGEVYQSGWKTIIGQLLLMNNRLYAYVFHPDCNAIESLAIFAASGTFPANAC